MVDEKQRTLIFLRDSNFKDNLELVVGNDVYTINFYQLITWKEIIDKRVNQHLIDNYNKPGT